MVRSTLHRSSRDARIMFPPSYNAVRLHVMTILQKVRRTVRDYHMIGRGDSVLVALSGGPDSVALLRLLLRLRTEQRLSLAAVYVNHRIRPRAARKEEEFCQKLCERYRIDLTIVAGDVPALAKSSRTGLEETAREFRYGVFEQLAERDGHDRIALGHQIDDRVETVLFRLLRGTGRSGLAGIPAARGKIIRPLYDLTRAEILTYLRRIKQSYCEDLSNRDLEFSRNYIRNRLLPEIRRRVNPRADSALLGLSEIVASEEQFLEPLVTKAVRKVVHVSPGGKLALDLPRFCGYDTWVRKRLLRRCLKALSARSLTAGRETIRRLDRLCEEDRKAMSVPGGLHAVKTDDRLVLYRKAARGFRESLPPGKSVPLEYPRVRFRSRVSDGGTELVRAARQSRSVTVDWDKVRPPLVLRSIRPGDRFRPLGLRGSKKVSNYLTDRKVPRVLRDEVPLLCDRDGIIWLVGFEIADRVKIDKTTRKVLTVECHVRKNNAAAAV